MSLIENIEIEYLIFVKILFTVEFYVVKSLIYSLRLLGIIYIQSKYEFT